MLVNVVFIVLFAAVAVFAGSWPAAILMTPLWAVSFLPAYRVARLATSPGRLVAGAAAALSLVALAGIGLAASFYVLGCSW